MIDHNKLNEISLKYPNNQDVIWLIELISNLELILKDIQGNILPNGDFKFDKEDLEQASACCALAGIVGFSKEFIAHAIHGARLNERYNMSIINLIQYRLGLREEI